jgi:hypothetical protein
MHYAIGHSASHVSAAVEHDGREMGEMYFIGIRSKITSLKDLQASQLGRSSLFFCNGRHIASHHY